ncbi:MAG: FHA domain-containing protein [Bacteroidales bacterium]|nr:FHA domain-containing protein [Bacteroidales bacterium]
MKRLLKYIAAMMLWIISTNAYSQDLKVISIDDNAYPEIVVRARVLASVEDSMQILEKGNNIPCSVEESDQETSDRDGKMHVFLVENSYYLHHNEVFPQVKKALQRIGDYLQPSDNANILYFGPQGRKIRLISAEQTSDIALLSEIVNYHLYPEYDSTTSGNDLSTALNETVDYCQQHRTNHETIILTLISRGLNIGSERRLAEDLAQRSQDNGIYLNILMYDSESQNVRQELQELASATEGSFSLFDAKNIEPVLAQSLEKMGKAKYKEYFKELVVTFNATQNSANNSFSINYGNTSILCEYTNPEENSFIWTYPQIISLVMVLALVATAMILFFRYRTRIIRRIDSHTQTNVEEIKRQNRILKQEIEKYKRHPLNMAHKFDNIYVEETLIGAGKIVPKLVAMDGDKQQVFNITKLTMTIGRNDANDIVLDNRTVSGSHATLTNEGGLFYLADNDSTNGIFVNDIRITKSKITTDDRIRIGAVMAKIVY